MAIPANLRDPFHRSLRGRLEEQLGMRVDRLVRGGAALTETDTATVAEKYAAQVSYIEALNFVVELCDTIEQERFGPPMEDS